MGSDTWRLCNANYVSISCQNGAIGAILSVMALHKRYIVPYGVYLSDGVFAILRNMPIRPEQINLATSVNVLLI